MNFLDRFNLSTGERRLVVGGAIVLFMVLNAVFVWPHFMDWQRYNNRYAKVSTQLNNWNKEIEDSTGYNVKLEKLKGEGGTVPPEEQALDLLRSVSQVANQSGLMLGNISPHASSATTNSFFTESGVAIQFNAKEKSLVDFLYDIGKGNSIVRVAALSIRPDFQNFQLSGTATLMASYRKDLKKAAAAAELKKASQAASRTVSTNRPTERSKPPVVKLPNPK
ncbi:MAG: hypothetical protein JWN25_3307 [Verrucomicrobiales bacterium]|nr:hypothetical protein [Verrucomicrobiales bacterium]